MGKLTVSGLRAVLLLAVLNSAVAEKIYFMVGGNVTLELQPPVSEPITTILWKHGLNLLAEWVDGEVDLTYYGMFNGRTTLNTTTGRLDIKTMSGADAGLFTVEINSKVQAQSFEAEAIKEVPRPEILVRPLICSSASDRCTLTCEGDTEEAEPVTYSWKEGDGEWKQSGKDLDIIKNGTAHVKTFSCRMTNPVSEEESGPEVSPFNVARSFESCLNGVGNCQETDMS
uniref:CD48 antigen n=1 Tax=Oplegnathus fasciatus TaxID=163134 RepID=I7HB97_OPLFA|nr:CD48 antigen [Oplegnathus fasciatus]